MRQAAREWGRRHTVMLLVAAGVAALGLLYLVTNQGSDRQVVGALAQYGEEPPEEPGGPPGKPPGKPGEPGKPPDRPPDKGKKKGQDGTPASGTGIAGGGTTLAGGADGIPDCSLRQDSGTLDEQSQAPEAQAVRRAGGPISVPANNEACFSLVLSGDQVVPGPGDPDGLGRMEFTLGSICHEIEWMGIGRPTSITIREGVVGEKGPVVQKLIPNPDKSKTKRKRQVKRLSTPLDDCVLDRFDETLNELLTPQPRRYYVEIANKKFPKGALRGQITELDRALRLEHLVTLKKNSDTGSFLRTDGKRSR